MDEKIYLITTSLEETYKKKYKNIYLHPWIEENKIKFNDYPNRYNVIDDFNYCSDLYEKILPEVSKILNEIHKKKFDLEFWIIFIGPWLKQFIWITNDRWKRLINFKNKNFFSNTLVVKYKDEDIAMNDYHDFTCEIQKDYLNSIVYNKILKFTNLCDIEEVPYEKKIIKDKTKLNITHLFKKKQKYLFLNTYLDRRDEIYINLKLKQFPIFRKRFNTLPIFHYKKELRNKKIDLEKNSEFEKFLCLNIFKFMPRVFLEGFFDLDDEINVERLPDKPKCIIIGNIPSHSHIVKYLALQKIKKTKIICMQTGGDSNYWEFTRSKNKELSNIFLIWSKYRDTKSIKSIGFIKKRFVSKNPKKIVLFLNNNPKYVFKPGILAYQMYNGYIERIINFIGKLHPQVQNDLLVRIIDFDSWWSLKKKILKYYPNIKFCDENTKIGEIYKNSKLVISTHIGTTMIEALTSNIPACVLIDDYQFDVIKNKQKKYYKLLQNINILHTDLSECSEHINDLLLKDNLNNWWNTSEIKNNVSEFKENICFHNPNLSKDIIEIIQK
jgi:putative transferase (TIGR04331 family)